MESSPNNTYVFDPESPTEMARLINQDRILTQSMGGALSGIADPSSLRNILDLGCGPGSWVLDVAFELADAEVEGVDISRIMVDYANARARTQQLSNASFGVMDITEQLDFPDASFDLVNARLLFAVLKRDVWFPFLKECMRVLRPGGLLRLTESPDIGKTSSAAVNQMGEYVMQAIWQRGYGFSPDGHSFGMTHVLPHLFQEQGCQHIRLLAHVLNYSVGTGAWADQYHNMEIVSLQMKPLLLKLGLTTEEGFDRLYVQALSDMQRETFLGMGFSLTVIGQKPLAEEGNDQ
jgi:ubiquinone/menaquinone biosynthesis C-methylase UbiE